MYTTRPLSAFKDHPEEASRPPPEGPNSGQLVVKSAADEGTRFFGLLADRRVRELPFPQNCVLKVRYTVRRSHGAGANNTTTTSTRTDEEAVVFVPVPGLPLASNRYYAVIAKGRRKGLVRACSREEDMATCCFCQCISDVEPRPFDPADVYQQMEVVRRRRGRFTARAVAADAFPPSLYRKKYWEVYASKSRTFDLGEAPGLDAALRSRQLVDAGLSVAAAAPAVGRWYCPFFLVKEHGVAPREQMERSAFYQVALEQRWEPMRGDAVRVRLAQDGQSSSRLASRKVLIGGNVEATAEAEGISSRHGGDAYVWFAAATGERVGVCTTVLEGMLREQGRGGWVDDEEKEAGDMAGGMVMVESFVVRRMDRSVVVAFDFVHHKFTTSRDGLRLETGA